MKYCSTKLWMGVHYAEPVSPFKKFPPLLKFTLELFPAQTELMQNRAQCFETVRGVQMKSVLKMVSIPSDSGWTSVGPRPSRAGKALEGEVGLLLLELPAPAVTWGLCLVRSGHLPV